MDPRPLGRERISLVAALIVAALALGMLAGPLLSAAANATRTASALAAGSDTPPEHSITVSGSGEVTVTPDLARVSLGVLVQRESAKGARQAAADSMSKVIARIKALGIADKDIATSSVSLSPVYDYNSNSSAPKIRGYQLQNSVTVTVRDLDKVGDVIDDGVAAGATSVDGISFDVADRAAAESQAREAAVKDAKARADTLAAGLGVHITGVATVAETIQTPIWYGPTYGAALTPARDAATPTPVQPGTTDVTINVTVTFLIG